MYLKVNADQYVLNLDKYIYSTPIIYDSIHFRLGDIIFVMYDNANDDINFI